MVSARVAMQGSGSAPEGVATSRRTTPALKALSPGSAADLNTAVCSVTDNPAVRSIGICGAGPTVTACADVTGDSSTPIPLRLDQRKSRWTLPSILIAAVSIAAGYANALKIALTAGRSVTDAGLDIGLDTGLFIELILFSVLFWNRHKWLYVDNPGEPACSGTVAREKIP
jgi:hypothetical protein